MKPSERLTKVLSELEAKGHATVGELLSQMSEGPLGQYDALAAVLNAANGAMFNWATDGDEWYIQPLGVNLRDGDSPVEYAVGSRGSEPDDVCMVCMVHQVVNGDYQHGWYFLDDECVIRMVHHEWAGITPIDDAGVAYLKPEYIPDSLETLGRV